jgi:hypothetical protein
MSAREMHRRKFISGGALGAIATALAPHGSAAKATVALDGPSGEGAADAPPVDFRYAPAQWQTAICFPDDRHKSLVGERGEVRLSGKPLQWPHAPHPVQVEFTCLGMEADTVRDQALEAPGVPIVVTRLGRPEAEIRLTAFATNREGEGRVDNVLMEVVPKGDAPMRAVPGFVIRSVERLNIRKNAAGRIEVLIERDGKPVPFMACDREPAERWQRQGRENTGLAVHYALHSGEATREKPLRAFFRLSQEGQPFAKIATGLDEADALLAETRAFWREGCRGGTGSSWWRVPGTSCRRARRRRGG